MAPPTAHHHRHQQRHTSQHSERVGVESSVIEFRRPSAACVMFQVCEEVEIFLFCCFYGIFCGRVVVCIALQYDGDLNV